MIVFRWYLNKLAKFYELPIRFSLKLLKMPPKK